MNHSTKIAGIDVVKRWLDVAIYGRSGTRRFANDEAGLTGLVAWLAEAGVTRAGLSATGGYEPRRSNFKRYPIGYFHIDIAEVRTAEGKLCLLMAMELSGILCGRA